MRCSAICSVVFALATLSAFGVGKGQKMALAGSYAPNIIIIDRATGAVEWNLQIPDGGECNSVSVLPNGDVLFSYKQGVMLVDCDKNVKFDYKVALTEEAQSASVVKNRVVVGICGNPARIVELDLKGNVRREIIVDLKIEEPHSQFRQITKSASGSYLIPVMAQAKVIEISPKGELIKAYRTLDGPFSVSELKGGNLMVSAGCNVREIDRKTGQTLRILASEVIGVDTIRFATQAVMMPKGELIVTNWIGHSDGAADAAIIEIDALGRVVRRFCNTAAIKYVSAIFPFENK